MTGYTKLFSSIVTSTIWREPNHVRLVWITLLALADRQGVIDASLPGLADIARVSLDECREAMRVLTEPDAFSRTQEAEGRRVEPIDGGWRLINHAKYRAKLSQDERRRYNTQKQRQYRAARREGTVDMSTGVSKCRGLSNSSTQAEAKAEADPEAKADADTRAARAPVWRQREKATPLVTAHRTCRSEAAAACGRGVCVPAFLVEQWITQSGEAGADAVRAFVASVLAALPDGPIGDDPLKLWRAAWATRHGTRAPSQTRAGRTVAAVQQAIRSGGGHDGPF